MARIFFVHFSTFRYMIEPMTILAAKVLWTAAKVAITVASKHKIATAVALYAYT